MGTVVTNNQPVLEAKSEAYNSAEPPVPTVREVVLATLAYADLFDYPLTHDEVSRFQVGSRYIQSDIGQTLKSLVATGRIITSGGYYALGGRASLFAERRSRAELSAAVWKRAIYRARGVARTPFVRMVAVTGALSMNNVSRRPDIDLLVVAQPGRVWIARRLLILQVRLARLRGDDLCPNYILDFAHLELDQRDLFTAHELAQMVPLYGIELYRRMLRQNLWAEAFLPAAFPPSRLVDIPSRPQTPNPLLERILRLPVFDAWEHWECMRLRKKLLPTIGAAAEVICAPEQCKGHTGLHRVSVLARLNAKLDDLGLGGLFTRFLVDGPL